ncbi:MAG: hypothetical protein ACI82Z_001341, partial [Cellvibrionaceae bacterium]
AMAKPRNASTHSKRLVNSLDFIVVIDRPDY